MFFLGFTDETIKLYTSYLSNKSSVFVYLYIAKFVYAIKTKDSITCQKFGSQDVCKLLLVLLTKINLLYLLYSTAGRYCVLHVIRQNYSLKGFQRTLVLVTWVSLYLLSPLEFTGNCIIFFYSQDGKKVMGEPWFNQAILPWLYFWGDSEKLLTWIFIHTSWTLQYVSEREFLRDCWKVWLVVPVFENDGGKV